MFVEIRNPEYILEIARQQSVTRAAEKLFVTQSTLSQYLLKLEADVGMPLFLREKSGLVPTDAGQVCIRAAEDIVRISRSAEENIAALKNEGTIRLGGSTWGLELLAGCMAEFRDRFPAISLKIREDGYFPLKNLLAADKLDMAIMPLLPEDDRPSQGHVHLCDVELVLILPPRAPFCLENPGVETIRREVLTEDLRGTEFILSGEGTSVRRLAEQMFSELMFRPNILCELKREDIICTMVAGGAGAAIVPLGDARQVPGVRYFHLDPPLGREDILVYRRGVEKTAAMACLEALLIARAKKEA